MSLFAFGRGQCADIVIQPTQTYQTIAGWGHGGGVLGATELVSGLVDPSLADPVNYQYLDYILDDLGLTGSRTWEVGPRIDGTGIDHGDCDVVDWSLFESDTFSTSDATYLLYYQNRILAKGYQPSFYSSPGYPTHASDQKPWVMNHPGERAQQIWASSLYLETNFGLNISYAVIYNEPNFTYSILSDDIKALGPRLLSHGLATTVQYAEAVAPQTDWGYITPVTNDPVMWPYVGRISYHNYGTADPYRSYLRDFASAKGLTTAQTEMGNPTFDDLFNDLTLAGVSYWEVAYSGSSTLVPTGGLTTFTPSATYFRLRELLHYVRPGAVRIGAVSSVPAVRVLAFLQGTAITTVIENTSSSAQTVNLNGLPPGLYGVSQALYGAPSFQELGIHTVGTNSTLSVTNMTGNSAVTTVYPYAGTNLPPTIEVWGVNPGYLAAPTNTATLSVTASDPELNPLTYHWSVTNQPAGANALLATPNSTTTAVSGLTVPGTYIFNIDVEDAVNTSSKEVYLAVYDTNPPPVLGQSGFRIAAPYGLVFGNPTNTTHAYIELPTSAVTLQVGIADLANSDFTGRGTWSVVSQPPGANVGLSSTVYIYVSIRANVTNMTVPGDYVFQVNVTNPGQPDLTAQIICTVNPATSPPVISSITASPPSLTLPASSLQLSAVTSGSTNQPLRHWWVVKSAPPGAQLLFDHQGLTNTTVSNVVMPGSYTLTLRAFDDLHETTQDKTFTVSAATGAPVITSAAAAFVVLGNAFSYTITASGSPSGFNAMGLTPGLTSNNGVIAGTPTIAGTYNIQLVATNGSGAGYGNLTLTVALPLPVITSSAIADGFVNTAFSYTVQAINVATGFGANGLPPALALDPVQGTITGTPTNAGTFDVTITATNSTGVTTAPLTILIYNGTAPVPGITSALTATGSVGAAFSYAITATNNPTSFFAISLPAGLVFNPVSGRIFGIPSVQGNFPVTIRASNGGGTGSASLALTIGPEPQPAFDAVAMRNGLALSFLTLTNRLYSVEWIDNLPGTNWLDLTNGIPGDANIQMVIDPVTNAPTRFYRLKVQTP
jgi:Putative Ig domain